MARRTPTDALPRSGVRYVQEAVEATGTVIALPCGVRGSTLPRPARDAQAGAASSTSSTCRSISSRSGM